MKEVEREREKSRQMWIKNCAKSKERREKNWMNIYVEKKNGNLLSEKIGFKYWLGAKMRIKDVKKFQFDKIFKKLKLFVLIFYFFFSFYLEKFSFFQNFKTNFK
jgi:hypothetical protein